MQGLNFDVFLLESWKEHVHRDQKVLLKKYVYIY